MHDGNASSAEAWVWDVVTIYNDGDGSNMSFELDGSEKGFAAGSMGVGRRAA